MSVYDDSVQAGTEAERAVVEGAIAERDATITQLQTDLANEVLAAQAAEQAQADAEAATAALQAEYDDLEAQYDALDAAFNAYVLKHPDTLDGGVALIGANYGGGDRSQFLGRADAARCFFSGSTLPDDITNDADFAAAYAEGIRVFVLSWKSQSDAEVRTFLSSLPDDVTAYGAFYHEVEDNIARGDISLTTYREVVARHAAIMDELGVNSLQIFMAYTLASGSGRDIADYIVPGVKVLGFDYYMNPAKGKDNPEGKVDQIVSVAAAHGISRCLFGENGVPDSVAEDTRVALLLRLRSKVLSTPEFEAACYWSTDDMIFTARTADAWFEGAGS